MINYLRYLLIYLGFNVPLYISTLAILSHLSFNIKLYTTIILFYYFIIRYANISYYFIIRHIDSSHTNFSPKSNSWGQI